LSEVLGQPLPDQPRANVDAAAGGKARDDPHRPRRVIFRESEPRERRRRGGGSEPQELSAAKCHERFIPGVAAKAQW
jgi:hypothetical protein